MMQRKILILLIIPVLQFWQPVYAGKITAELQHKLSTTGQTDELAVIVRLKNSLDVRRIQNRQQQQRRRNIILALRQRSDMNQRAIRRLLYSLRAKKTHQLWLINGLATTVPAWMVNALSQMPQVESVTLDSTLNVPVTNLAIAPTNNWNLTQVGAPDLWLQGITGQNTVVAILDTGVDLEHPDLATKWRGAIDPSSTSWFDTFDVNGVHPQPYDDDGHGTHALGVVMGGSNSGIAIGMAPDAQWIAAKIFDAAGNAPISHIHQALQWLLDPDGDPNTDDAPDVVSNSWGFSNWLHTCNNEFSIDFSTLKQAGIAVVFAAGNSGPTSASDLAPANDPLVMSVGAVDEQGNITSFSSRGASACNGAIFPNLTAPGANIYTADLSFGGLNPDPYFSVNGTSFSAPHVAGALALLKSAMINMGVPVTVSQLEMALTVTATDLGVPGPDNVYGNGLLNVTEAYHWLLTDVVWPQAGDLEFSAASFSSVEDNGFITVTLTRSAGSYGTVTVAYNTQDGTAFSGIDYTASSGVLTFLPGQVSQSLTIPLLSDNLQEGDEDFFIQLSSPTSGAVLGINANTTVTIIDSFNSPPITSKDAGFAQQNMLVDNTSAVISNGEINLDFATGGTSTISILQNDSDDGLPVDSLLFDGNRRLGHGAVNLLGKTHKINGIRQVHIGVNGRRYLIKISRRGGLVAYHGDGTVLYKPPVILRGFDGISYTIRDGGGLLSNRVAVRINVK
ncbi:MAG: S8 family serine peptidase [Methylococcaceae bacterium]|nr:S8 family serine peptidase [Methylococcaceae bacterium]